MGPRDFSLGPFCFQLNKMDPAGGRRPLVKELCSSPKPPPYWRAPTCPPNLPAYCVHDVTKWVTGLHVLPQMSTHFCLWSSKGSIDSDCQKRALTLFSQSVFFRANCQADTALRASSGVDLDTSNCANKSSTGFFSGFVGFVFELLS
jgi:hypothetical protein